MSRKSDIDREFYDRKGSKFFRFIALIVVLAIVYYFVRMYCLSMFNTDINETVDEKIREVEEKIEPIQIS